MFTGDAAAATDPMTGEGIGQALLTGRLAAEALLGDTDPLRHYEAQSAELWPTTAWLWASVACPPRNRRRSLASDRGNGLVPPELRSVDVRGLSESHDRHPRRWHRGMFTGPGAFAN